MDDARTGKGIIYQAPAIFVGLFYTLLTIWTVVSVPLIVLKSSDLSSLLLLMITFVIAYTWYFSLGIFYRIRMEENGSIQLKSLRRGLRSHCRKIDRVDPVLDDVQPRFLGQARQLSARRRVGALA